MDQLFSFQLSSNSFISSQEFWRNLFPGNWLRVGKMPVRWEEKKNCSFITHIEEEGKHNNLQFISLLTLLLSRDWPVLSQVFMKRPVWCEHHFTDWQIPNSRIYCLMNQQVVYTHYSLSLSFNISRAANMNHRMHRIHEFIFTITLFRDTMIELARPGNFPTENEEENCRKRKMWSLLAWWDVTMLLCG